MESNDSNQIPNKRVGTFYNITYKYSSPKKLVSSWSTTYAKIVLYYIFSIQTLNSDELLNRQTDLKTCVGFLSSSIHNIYVILSQ